MALSKETEPAVDPLVARLMPLDTFQRYVETGRGVCVLLAGLIIYLLVVGWLDWSIRLSTPVRAVLLLVITLAAATYLARRHVIAAIRRQLKLPVRNDLDAHTRVESLARLVDRCWWPELKGSVLCAVQFSRLIETGTHFTGSELARISVARITRRLAERRLSKAVPLTGLIRLIAALVGLTMVAVGTAFSCPAGAAVSLSRLLLLQNTRFPTRTVIVSVDPGDVTVKQGETRSLEVTAKGEIPENGTARIMSTGKEETRLTLLRAGEDRFRVQFPDVDADFAYEIHLGDAVSDRFRVHVLPRPRLSLATRVVTEQEGRDKVEETAGGDVTVLEGASVFITAKSTKPLLNARLDAEPLIGAGQPVVTASQLRLARILAKESFTYRLHVTDSDEVTNHPPRTYRVRVTPDRPPKVSLETGNETIEMLPNGRLGLTYSAADDFGLGKIEMLFVPRRVQREQTRQKSGSIPVADGAGQRAHTGHFEWDLGPHDLLPGDSVVATLRVRDTRTLGANVAESRPLRVAIVTRNQLEQRWQKELARTVEDDLVPIADELRQLRADIATAATKPAVDHQELADLTARQHALGGRLAAFEEHDWAPLGDWLRQNGVDGDESFSQFASMRQQISSVCQQELTAAESALGAAQQTSDGEEVRTKTNEAAELDETAAQKLGDLIDRATPFATLERCQDQLEEILEKQKELLGETRVVCLQQLSSVDPIPSETCRDLSQKQQRVSAPYADLTTKLSQMAESPERPETVKNALEVAQRFGILESVQDASDHLERGQLLAAFESEYDACRGMLQQAAQFEVSDGDRRAKADAFAVAMDRLGEQQTKLQKETAQRADSDHQRAAPEQDAATWALQQAAEDVRTFDPDAADSLDRAVRQSAKATEDLFAGHGEAAQRRQQTAADEIARAQRRLEQLGTESPVDVASRDYGGQAGRWEKIQHDAEELAGEQQLKAEAPESEQLQADQEKLAARTERLAEVVANEAPNSEPAQALREAQKHAQQAANEMAAGGNRRIAREEQQAAAERMRHAANEAAMRNEAARARADNEKMSRLDEAEQQLESSLQNSEELAEQMQHMGEGSPPSAMGEMARTQADEAERLAHQAKSATAGRKELQQASEHARQASQKMSEGDLDAAAEQQQMANSNMQSAQEGIQQAKSEPQAQIEKREEELKELQDIQEQVEAVQEDMESMKRQMQQQESNPQMDSQQSSDEEQAQSDQQQQAKSGDQQQQQAQSGKQQQSQDGQQQQGKSGDQKQQQAQSGKQQQSQDGQQQQGKGGGQQQQGKSGGQQQQGQSVGQQQQGQGGGQQQPGRGGGQQQGESGQQQQDQQVQQLQQMASRARGTRAGDQQLSEAHDRARLAQEAMDQGDMREAIQRQDEAIRALGRAQEELKRWGGTLSPASDNLKFADVVAPPSGGELPGSVPEIESTSPQQHGVSAREFQEVQASLKAEPPVGYEKRMKGYYRYFRNRESDR